MMCRSGPTPATSQCVHNREILPDKKLLHWTTNTLRLIFVVLLTFLTQIICYFGTWRSKEKRHQGCTHKNLDMRNLPLLQNAFVERGSDFSNGHLVTYFYCGSSVMSRNHLSLLWLSVATGSGDITSSPIATVTIW
jgi:hypothetical protein